MQNPDDKIWSPDAVRALLRQLGSDPARGLESGAAARRLAEVGPNRVGERPKALWLRRTIAQFNSPLILILALGVVLSAFIGEWQDAVTITAIILINALLGFVQEWRAERAVAALQRLLSPTARVLREGVEQEISADKLVPGDIVLLEHGVRVPADLVLLDSQELLVDESALTGESMPVAKATAAAANGESGAQPDCVAFAGTLVLHGHAKALVTATGRQTRFGHITALTGAIRDEPTTLQRELQQLARQLGIASVGVGILVVFAGLLAGRTLAEIGLMAVSLAIAVVPEGLPAVVTLTLALGVHALSRRGALVRRLQAAETLGAATVICTDKTGTLTQNRMTVVSLWVFDVFLDWRNARDATDSDTEESALVALPDSQRSAFDAMLRCAVECNNAKPDASVAPAQFHGLPTEIALLEWARSAGAEVSGRSPRSHEFAFDSTRKRMTVVTETQTRVFTKGAPEVVASLCRWIQVGNDCVALDARMQQRVEAAYAQSAQGGLRVLALAGRDVEPRIARSADLKAEDVETDLVLYGLVAIADPPRAEVPAAIQTAHDAGIQIIMVTGDGAATAANVAQAVGLVPTVAVDGSEIGALNDHQLRAALVDGAVLSRVAPEHKLRIVRLLQQDRQVVAMTGDGVNDAPALRQANVGVAMGERGTDAAKEASDIVLADDNFASMINAIAEGRRQYENIRRFVAYMLSSNAGEVIAIVCNVLFGGPLILIPVQILWMNLVTDGVTAVALGAEPGTRLLMQQPPRPVEQSLLQREHVLLISVLGLYIGGVTFGVFLWCLNSAENGGLGYAQTMAFTTIIMLEKFNVFNFRSLREPLSRIGWLSNRWVIIAWIATVGSQVAVVYLPFFNDLLHTVPLAATDWLLIIGLAVPVFLIPECCKVWLAR